MSDFLAINLEALRARTGLDPVLEPAAWPADAREPEGFAGASARLVGAVGGTPLTTVFVIGCGTGAILDAIEAHSPAADIIALEPNRAHAQQLLASRDFSESIRSGHLTLLIGPEYPNASGAWRPQSVPVDVPVLVDPGLARLSPDAVREADAVVRHVIQDARSNADARRANAARYLLHTLANAARIAREGDVAALQASFSGTPAIIVGAGPTLDGRLGELAAVADRAVVIACAAAARPLFASHIAPHFIVSSDPSEMNATHLTGLGHTRQSWLVGEGSLHPTAFSGFDRRTFFFKVSDHHPWPWLRSLGIERGSLATWGSAATSSLDFALRLGCSPIVFAGLDFAFVDGRPYCRGTAFEAEWMASAESGQTLEIIWRRIINRWPLTLEADADGQLVRTAPHLVSFRDWMRQQIEHASATRFLNATPGGILHHAFVEESSFQALARSPRLDARATDAHIRSIHRATADASTSLFAGIDRLINDAHRLDDETLEAWSAFSAGVVRKEMSRAALRSHEYEAWDLGRRSALVPLGIPQ